MSENQYAITAEYILKNGGESVSNDTRAIVEANLAVAYELRTANLIAVAESYQGSNPALLKLIDERLGMEK